MLGLPARFATAVDDDGGGSAFTEVVVEGVAGEVVFLGPPPVPAEAGGGGVIGTRLPLATPGDELRFLMFAAVDVDDGGGEFEVTDFLLEPGAAMAVTDAADDEA